MEKIPKLKEMSLKERITYIWDYYKWVFIIAVIAVIVVISVVRHFLAYKETALYIVLANADTFTYSGNGSELFTDFLEEEGINPKKEEVTVNTSIRYLSGQSMTDIYGMQALTTVMGSGTADVCVMNEELYEQVGSLGAFIPVQFYLTEEEMEELSERIIWVPSDPDISSIAEAGESEEAGTLYARGIRISDENPLTESGLYTAEGTYVGIAEASKRTELAAKLVRELVGLPAEINP